MSHKLFLLLVSEEIWEILRASDGCYIIEIVNGFSNFFVIPFP